MSVWVKRDNTEAVIAGIDAAINAGLIAIGTTAESHAKELITIQRAVRTGRLRNSITYALSGQRAAAQMYNDMEGHAFFNAGIAPVGKDGERAVYVGTNVHYAASVEFGYGWNVRKGPRPYLYPTAANYGQEYRGLMEDALKNAPAHVIDIDHD